MNARLVLALALHCIARAALGQDATLFFFNGVCNTEEQGRDSAELLASEFQATLGLSREEYDAKLPTQLLYNSSFKDPTGFSAPGCLFDLFEATTQTVANGGLGFSPRQFWRYLHGREVPLADAQTWSGLAERLASGIELDLAEADLSHHLSAYGLALKSAPVIAVGHSQGNFFENEVYSRLEGSLQPSVGTVGVATPASKVAGNGPHWTSFTDFIYLTPGALLPNTLAGFCLTPWTCHAFANYLEEDSQSHGDIMASLKQFLETLPPPPSQDPSPTPVTIFQVYPSLTTGDHIGLFWTRSDDSEFVAYEVYRAVHPEVTTSDTRVAELTNQDQVYYRDDGLASGTYFYRVFTVSRSGSRAASNEVTVRVFAPEEIVHRIPGVPEPGDTGLPVDVAIPNHTLEISIFDCPRDPTSPFTCLGSFTTVSLRVDGEGHVSKRREFMTSIEANLLDGVSGLRYILHQSDQWSIVFSAVDDTYGISVPFYGHQISVPQGESRLMAGGVGGEGNSEILLESSDGTFDDAGFLVVVP